MKKIELLTVIVIAALISIFYYGPFLDNYFAWDDYWFLANFTSGNFKDVFFGFEDLRIFGNLLFQLNFIVSGHNPASYSLIAISIHIASSAMLFLLIYSISNDRLLSIFTAVIFAASSVGCDAILWRAAFHTVTGLFFYLLVLYLYVEGNKSGDRFYHNLALMIFILAMFNKEEIASVPFMIIFIEALFFRDGAQLKSRLSRLLPYFLIIILYIFLSLILTRFLNIRQAHLYIYRFNPLNTLFSGFASFFVSPEGRLDWNDPFMYIMVSLLVLSCILIKERKMLVFGYGWAFLTFLPQSLAASGYNSSYLIGSISRHLYLPSVGPAIVFSVILLFIRKCSPRKVFVITAVFFFTAFIIFNYERIGARGRQWQEDGGKMKVFLYSLKNVQPDFPENAHVYMVNVSGARAFFQWALRAFYGNPKIYWTEDPARATHIFLYLNGYITARHESVMKLVKHLSTSPIDSILTFYDLKGWEKQKLEFLHAISANSPPDADRHLMLARIYGEIGQLNDAESEFKAALTIKPHDADIHYGLGLVYMMKREHSQALKEFDFVARTETSPLASTAKEAIDYIKKRDK